MRPFSPRMFPARVVVTPVAEEAGRSGGVREVPGTPRPAVPGRIRIFSEREGTVAMGEVALARAQVAFPADPEVKLGDRLAAGGVELRALGPARARDGAGVLFVVECEVVEQGRGSG